MRYWNTSSSVLLSFLQRRDDVLLVAVLEAFHVIFFARVVERRDFLAAAGDGGKNVRHVADVVVDVNDCLDIGARRTCSIVSIIAPLGWPAVMKMPFA